MLYAKKKATFNAELKAAHRLWLPSRRKNRKYSINYINLIGWGKTNG